MGFVLAQASTDAGRFGNYFERRSKMPRASFSWMRSTPSRRRGRHPPGGWRSALWHRWGAFRVIHVCVYSDYFHTAPPLWKDDYWCDRDDGGVGGVGVGDGGGGGGGGGDNTQADGLSTTFGRRDLTVV